mmetsp:Transcript_97149/g.253103  ORF Transcript_97149/g.253103 Transcript_97149/m.253103 type:complete len:251 (+) Transcript_97149:687-1439(+)
MLERSARRRGPARRGAPLEPSVQGPEAERVRGPRRGGGGPQRRDGQALGGPVPGPLQGLDAEQGGGRRRAGRGAGAAQRHALARLCHRVGAGQATGHVAHAGCARRVAVAWAVPPQGRVATAGGLRAGAGRAAGAPQRPQHRGGDGRAERPLRGPGGLPLGQHHQPPRRGPHRGAVLPAARGAARAAAAGRPRRGRRRQPRGRLEREPAADVGGRGWEAGVLGRDVCGAPGRQAAAQVVPRPARARAGQR